MPQQGSIVSAASVNSILSGAGTSGYTAAKHGVVGITKAVRVTTSTQWLHVQLLISNQACLEGRTHGIRVNCVSPGFLLTDLLKPALADGRIDSEAWKGYEARQGRLATFNEVGDVVVLLSTPRMSLVNGHNLVIDGGFTVNENNS